MLHIPEAPRVSFLHRFKTHRLPKLMCSLILFDNSQVDSLGTLLAHPLLKGAIDLLTQPLAAILRVKQQKTQPPIMLSGIISDNIQYADQVFQFSGDANDKLVVRCFSFRVIRQERVSGR